ncbi:MAG: DUF3426 domain-containing protein [Deltaproteobacteria bacterium]|nr:DUF3426 domain-containing protein [Deltaproteobacteria bacterium]
MIIQCEKCRTRFRLDDAKISEAGVRVRCSRCTHTFIVRREAPDEETDFDSILQGLGDSDSENPESTSAAGEPEVPAESGIPAEPEVSAEPEISARPEIPDELEMPAEPGIHAAPENQTEPEMAAEPEPAAESGSSEKIALPEWEFDEQESCAGDGEPNADDAAEYPEQRVATDESFAGFFKKGVGLPQFQVPKDSAAFAAGTEPESDAPAAAPDVADADAATEDSEVRVLSSEVEGNTPLPVEQEMAYDVRIHELRERRWPVADGGDEEAADDELPPLSIASRRKGLPLFPSILAAVLVLVLGGVGFYLTQNSLGSPLRFLPDSAKNLLGIAGEDTGGATIRFLEGTFLDNREAGQLFVMRGEVFNSSGKPFSALQVKGTVYGANGEVMAQRTVFCGNTLSSEQLAFESFSSMEKAMGRQFGDTLANLEVLPGKAVPFVIVFRDLPRGATDYGATVAGPAGMGR